MEILLLTPQLPYPPQQGTALRNFNIIRGLAARHALTLLSFTARSVDEQISAVLREKCKRIVTIPQPPERSALSRLWEMMITDQPDMALRLRSHHFEIALRRILSENTFDIVQVEGIELAWTLPILRSGSVGQNVVFDAHNAEAYLQQRAYEADARSLKRLPAALYSRIQTRRLYRYEQESLKQADWITAVSENDRQVLNAQMEKQNISVIPNCIDVEEYARKPEFGSPQPGGSLLGYDLVFTGKMDYRPNVDAVLWFAHEVWPKILENRPQSTWVIVGQKPHKRLQSLHNIPGITLTGWVEQVTPFLHEGKVFIMPFRVGSGTRLKLIEAMAAGIPVVSTALGVEGYAVRNEQHLLIADSPAEMATAILRLLREPQTRARLVKQGQQFAARYDWRGITPKFDEVYYALAA